MQTILDLLNDIYCSLPSEGDSEVQKIIKYTMLPGNLISAFGSFKHSLEKEQLLFVKSDLLFSIINCDPLKKFYKKYIRKVYIDTDPNHQAVYDFKDIGQIYFIVNKINKIKDKHTAIYLSKNFNLKALGDLIYKTLGNKIFIEHKRTGYTGRDDGEGTSIGEYFLDIVEHSDKILSFSSHKETKEITSNPGTYLFFGPPGTGKSTFIFSDHLKDKRCIKMLAEDFAALSTIELKILFTTFAPDLILLEELDKSNYKLNDILIFLERIRKNKMSIVFTANKINVFDKSLIRPGRIDKLVKFKLPEKNEILELVNYFSPCTQEINVKLTELFFEKKMSHAYIVDLCKRVTNNNYDEVEKYLNFLDEIDKE